MAQKTTLKEFESVFPKLEETLVAHAEKYKLPEDFVKWYRTVSQPGLGPAVAPLAGGG